MNLLLIIVLAILVVFMVIGVRKGFIKMLFGTLALAITIILSLLIAPHFAGFLKENTSIYDKVYEKTSEYISGEVGEKFNDHPNAQNGAIERLALPTIVKTQLSENNTSENYAELGAVSFTDYIAASISMMVLKALAFLILFVIIAVALRIVVGLLDLIAKLPIIRQANKLLGFLFGLLQGLIIVWIIFVFITLISTSEIGQKAMAMINDSDFLNFLYNHNYLTKFVISIFKI